MLTRRQFGLSTLAMLAMSSFAISTTHPRRPDFAAERAPLPRPECPQGGDWQLFFLGWHGDSINRVIDVPSRYTAVKTPHSALIGYGQPALSGPITDIVEFHDCQQFIMRTGARHEYIDLFAIFARLHLDSAYVPPVHRAQPQVIRTLPPRRRTDRTRANPPIAAAPPLTAFDPLHDGIPMAYIFAYRRPYEPLALREGFNCLHFFRRTDATGAPHWVAKITWVGRDGQAQCAEPLPASQGDVGQLFQVDRGPTLPSAMLPPVARWDWDSINHRQYIGIRCEDAWCEVRPKLPVGGGFHASASIANGSHSTKGWYDEQILAVPPPSASPTPPAQVSAIKGTIIPDAALGNDAGQDGATSRFNNTWQEVATVRLDNAPGDYTTKLNFVRTTGTPAENHVGLCFGMTAVSGRNPCLPLRIGLRKPLREDGTPCSTGWMSRVGRGLTGEGSERYFCVTRRGHDHDTNGVLIPHIPGIVRWRWALDDETMWIRCMQGCCEVRAQEL